MSEKKPYIVTTGANGRCVLFGWSETKPQPGENYTLHNSRMVLYWPSACRGLLGLAADGPKDGLRLSGAVIENSGGPVVQVLCLTDTVGRALDAWDK